MANKFVVQGTIKGSESEQFHHMEMLLNITHTIAAMDTIDEVLSALVGLATMEIKAERGTIFLNDAHTGELYSRVAQGNVQREIRLLNTSGIAGSVFHADEL
ncbi:hypothetical protein JYT23_01115 [Mariprofundus ferrooxydans]|nr:hypothetical protein [Mariprofundus ferrooxydans]